MVCTRTIGYNHIDLAHAKEVGMIVTHIYYLLDLDVIATVPVDKSNVAPYRNALDLTNVSSFETLTNRQIAKEISVIFDIIDLWHRPKAWKEVRSKIGSHYKSQRDG